MRPGPYPDSMQPHQFSPYYFSSNSENNNTPVAPKYGGNNYPPQQPPHPQATSASGFYAHHSVAAPTYRRHGSIAAASATTPINNPSYNLSNPSYDQQPSYNFSSGSPYGMYGPGSLNSPSVAAYGHSSLNSPATGGSTTSSATSHHSRYINNRRGDKLPMWCGASSPASFSSSLLPSSKESPKTRRFCRSLILVIFILALFTAVSGTVLYFATDEIVTKENITNLSLSAKSYLTAGVSKVAEVLPLRLTNVFEVASSSVNTPPLAVQPVEFHSSESLEALQSDSSEHVVPEAVPIHPILTTLLHAESNAGDRHVEDVQVVEEQQAQQVQQ